MHPDDVRDLFACIDVGPSATFSESLLTRLQAEAAIVDRVSDGDVEGSLLAPILLDLRSEPRPSDRRAERPRGRPSRGRVVAAAAAAAVIVISVAIATRDDGVDLETPPVDQPSTTEPTGPPMAVPRGLHALPPEGADPSLPVNGELLAELPMPIWVYEDGRVISARWFGLYSWDGFLEQRLTPEGVELVRSEILATHPSQELCRPGGPGGYGFSDGGRMVCAHSTSGAWAAVAPRLYDLPDGGPTWLPPSAWADPVPKPYVPSSYAIRIQGDGKLTRDAVLADLPPAITGVLASAPPCEFELFPPSHGDTLCWKVTTDQARAIVNTDGFTAQYLRGILMGPGWGYFFEMPPYLPHDKAVWCCGG